MIEYIQGIAEAHQVNPVAFVLIYLVSTVPFLLVSGWLVHHIRHRRPLALLSFVWALCYSAPYIYIVIVGREFSVWIYVLVAALIAAGLALAARGLMRRLAEDAD